MTNTIEEIRQIIETYDSIAISGHTSPDGDAIGACASLAMSLSLLGKDVRVILDDYPEVFNIIPTGGLFTKEAEEGYIPQLYIALDCGDKERLGKNAELFDKALNTVCIDHHMSNTNFAKANYVDVDASSTSEIIFQLLYGYAPLDSDIAAAMYSGIVFDTGGFRHSSTSSITMAIVSELMEYDFDFSKIYNLIFYSRSFEEAKILGNALDNLSKHFDGKCVSSYITREEMEHHGVTSDNVSEVVNYLKGIKNALVSVFIYEKDKDIFKVSMRSEAPVDVCAVAQVFGGGGHMYASGFTLQGVKEEILANVLSEIEKQL